MLHKKSLSQSRLHLPAVNVALVYPVHSNWSSSVIKVRHAHSLTTDTSNINFWHVQTSLQIITDLLRLIIMYSPTCGAWRKLYIVFHLPFVTRTYLKIFSNNQLIVKPHVTSDLKYDKYLSVSVLRSLKVESTYTSTSDNHRSVTWPSGPWNRTTHNSIV